MSTELRFVIIFFFIFSLISSSNDIDQKINELEKMYRTQKNSKTKSKKRGIKKKGKRKNKEDRKRSLATVKENVGKRYSDLESFQNDLENLFSEDTNIINKLKSDKSNLLIKLLERQNYINLTNIEMEYLIQDYEDIKIRFNNQNDLNKIINSKGEVDDLLRRIDFEMNIIQNNKETKSLERKKRSAKKKNNSKNNKKKKRKKNNKKRGVKKNRRENISYRLLKIEELIIKNRADYNEEITIIKNLEKQQNEIPNRERRKRELENIIKNNKGKIRKERKKRWWKRNYGLISIWNLEIISYKTEIVSINIEISKIKVDNESEIAKSNTAIEILKNEYATLTNLKEKIEKIEDEKNIEIKKLTSEKQQYEIELTKLNNDIEKLIDDNLSELRIVKDKLNNFKVTIVQVKENLVTQLANKNRNRNIENIVENNNTEENMYFEYVNDRNYGYFLVKDMNLSSLVDIGDISNDILFKDIIIIVDVINTTPKTLKLSEIKNNKAKNKLQPLLETNPNLKIITGLNIFGKVEIHGKIQEFLINNGIDQNEHDININLNRTYIEAALNKIQNKITQMKNVDLSEAKQFIKDRKTELVNKGKEIIKNQETRNVIKNEIINNHLNLEIPLPEYNPLNLPYELKESKLTITGEPSEDDNIENKIVFTIDSEAVVTLREKEYDFISSITITKNNIKKQEIEEEQSENNQDELDEDVENNKVVVDVNENNSDLLVLNRFFASLKTDENSTEIFGIEGSVFNELTFETIIDENEINRNYKVYGKGSLDESVVEFDGLISVENKKITDFSLKFNGEFPLNKIPLYNSIPGINELVYENVEINPHLIKAKVKWEEKNLEFNSLILKDDETQNLSLFLTIENDNQLKELLPEGLEGSFLDGLKVPKSLLVFSKNGLTKEELQNAPMELSEYLTEIFTEDANNQYKEAYEELYRKTFGLEDSEYEIEIKSGLTFLSLIKIDDLSNELERETKKYIEFDDKPFIFAGNFHNVFKKNIDESEIDKSISFYSFIPTPTLKNLSDDYQEVYDSLNIFDDSTVQLRFNYEKTNKKFDLIFSVNGEKTEENNDDEEETYKTEILVNLSMLNKKFNDLSFEIKGKLNLGDIPFVNKIDGVEKFYVEDIKITKGFYKGALLWEEKNIRGECIVYFHNNNKNEPVILIKADTPEEIMLESLDSDLVNKVQFDSGMIIISKNDYSQEEMANIPSEISDFILSSLNDEDMNSENIDFFSEGLKNGVTILTSFETDSMSDELKEIITEDMNIRDSKIILIGSIEGLFGSGNTKKYKLYSYLQNVPIPNDLPDFISGGFTDFISEATAKLYLIYENSKLNFGFDINGKIDEKDARFNANVIMENRRFKDISLGFYGNLNYSLIPVLNQIPGIEQFSIGDIVISQEIIQTSIIWNEKDVSGTAIIYIPSDDTSNPSVLFKVDQGLSLEAILPDSVVIDDLRGLELPQVVFGISKNGINRQNISEFPPQIVDFFEDITDNPNFQFELNDGVSLMFNLDPSQFKGDLNKLVEEMDLKDPLIIGLSVGGIFSGNASLGLYADIPTFTFPEKFQELTSNGFINTQGANATLFLNLSSAGAVNLGIDLGLDVRINEEYQRFIGQIALNAEATGVGIAFNGLMEGNLVDPFGLKGLTLSDTVLGVGLGATGSVTLTIAGKTRLDNYNYELQMSSTLQVSPAMGIPVPSEVILTFSADELGMESYLRFYKILLSSVASNPHLKQVLLDSVDSSDRATVENTLNYLSNLSVEQIMTELHLDDIPQIKFKDVDLYLVTPGASDPNLDIDGMGAAIKGTMLLDNDEIAEVDSYLKITGLKIYGNITKDRIGPLIVDQAIIDSALNKDDGAKIIINAETNLFGIYQLVDYQITKEMLKILYEGNFANFATVNYELKSIGNNLMSASDMTLHAQLTQDQDFIFELRRIISEKLDEEFVHIENVFNEIQNEVNTVTNNVNAATNEVNRLIREVEDSWVGWVLKALGVDLDKARNTLTNYTVQLNGLITNLTNVENIRNRIRNEKEALLDEIFREFIIINNMEVNGSLNDVTRGRPIKTDYDITIKGRRITGQIDTILIGSNTIDTINNFRNKFRDFAVEIFTEFLNTNFDSDILSRMTRGKVNKKRNDISKGKNKKEVIKKATLILINNDKEKDIELLSVLGPKGKVPKQKFKKINGKYQLIDEKVELNKKYYDLESGTYEITYRINNESKKSILKTSNKKGKKRGKTRKSSTKVRENKKLIVILKDGDKKEIDITKSAKKRAKRGNSIKKGTSLIFKKIKNLNINYILGEEILIKKVELNKTYRDIKPGSILVSYTVSIDRKDVTKVKNILVKEGVKNEIVLEEIIDNRKKRSLAKKDKIKKPKPVNVKFLTKNIKLFKEIQLSGAYAKIEKVKANRSYKLIPGKYYLKLIYDKQSRKVRSFKLKRKENKNNKKNKKRKIKKRGNSNKKQYETTVTTIPINFKEKKSYKINLDVLLENSKK